jgi:nicotinate (nicotinamide) nucleotide adenylyltransferase
MTPRIGVLGISANPPHLGHEMLVTSIMKSERFDKLYLILTGNRKDKQYVHPDHRVAMAELAFGRFRLHPFYRTDFIIRYSDVYSKNTPTITFLRNMQEEFPEAQLTFIVGSDLLYPQKDKKGQCEIETDWIEGKQLLKDFKFLVVPRKDYSVSLIPDRFDFINEIIPNISSTLIRDCIKHDVRFIEHVSGDVGTYIYRHHLYEINKVE